MIKQYRVVRRVGFPHVWHGSYGAVGMTEKQEGQVVGRWARGRWWLAIRLICTGWTGPPYLSAT